MTTPSTPLYREIKLTQGQVALVSAHRFEEINQFRWCARWDPSSKSFYAVRNIRGFKRRQHLLQMHRLILGLGIGDKREGDHVNRNTLDNCDENLRIATHSQNQHNRKVNHTSKSGIKGVSWQRKNRKWMARITIDGEEKYLGLFLTSEAAHAAYCTAAHQLRGEFARTE